MTAGPALIFYLLIVILPISALVARRLPARTAVYMGLAWVAIFGAGYLLFLSFT